MKMLPAENKAKRPWLVIHTTKAIHYHHHHHHHHHIVLELFDILLNFSFTAREN